MKPGKTAAVLMLRGRGARGAAARLFGGSPPSIAIEAHGAASPALALEPTYKHYGGIVDERGTMREELVNRLT
eukprot:8064827-Lingulodinium_polyedra.AAC.1